jgi:hypothetical protein
VIAHTAMTPSAPRPAIRGAQRDGWIRFLTP